ncbi:MAG: nuclear transport factor 2 family protein [Myxococcota bacterium]|nr:nuclear transport factor 2 family protein [Myxococcota bacterium]
MTTPAKDSNPAMVAARNSWRCVQAKDKQGWLDLMADSMVMEDPIGIAPTNPDGKGIQGKQAVSEFWDNTMSKVDIRIETHESFASANESAHRMTLTTTFENGGGMVVNGIFTYRIDEAGKLTNLRGYWAFDETEIRQPQ